MKAGARDRKITIQKRTITLDDHGGEVATWTKRCDVFAAVYYGTGAEQRSAALVQAAQSATFDVPAKPDVLAVAATDRILHDGLIWDVKSVALLGRAGARISATCMVP